MHKAHGDYDCLEAMHLCGCLCDLVHKAHMATMIAARRCMRVLVYVFLCTRRMVTVIAILVCAFMSVLVNKVHAHDDCCEAMHACVGVCSYAQGVCSL